MLNVGIIRITFILLFIKNNLFSFKFVISKKISMFCCLHFSLNLHYFFHFFPTKIAKLSKFETKKDMLVTRGGGNPTI